MKNGPATTEFWLTLAAMAVTLANEVFDMGLDREAVLSVVGSVAAYAVGRSIAKHG